MTKPKVNPEAIEALMDILALENHLIKSKNYKSLHDQVREGRQDFVARLFELDSQKIALNEHDDIWCAIKHSLLSAKQLREASQQESGEVFSYYRTLSYLFKGIGELLISDFMS